MVGCVCTNFCYDVANYGIGMKNPIFSRRNLKDGVFIASCPETLRISGRPGFLPGFSKNLIFLLTTTAVFGLLTAGREAFVGIRFGCYVICVITYIGDECLDVLGIGTVSEIGDGGLVFLYVDIDLLDTFFMTHVIFDPFLTGFALDRRGLDHNGLNGLLLSEGHSGKPKKQKGQEFDFLHNKKLIVGYKISKGPILIKIIN